MTESSSFREHDHRGRVASADTGQPSGARQDLQRQHLHHGHNIPSSLANSVFYEYYRAGASGNATVSAWSSDTQQYYSTVCSSDGTMVSCYPQGTSNRYATVQFSQNAVDVHPPDQAAAYAASGHAGPNG